VNGCIAQRSPEVSTNTGIELRLHSGKDVEKVGVGAALLDADTKWKFRTKTPAEVRRDPFQSWQRRLRIPHQISWDLAQLVARSIGYDSWH
jgi:hypothetical protein